MGGIYTTGLYQGSDLRLKKNISNLGYGLHEIMQLRPVSYQWREPADGKPNLGLIAQEVEQVIPEIVAHGTDEASMMGLNYTALVPVLIKAIQEQNAETVVLRARIAALEKMLGLEGNQ